MQAGKYIDGLIADLPPKNGWTLAELAGDETPDKMQWLFNHAVWDHRRGMAVVGEFVIEHLADPGAVLVLDESGQVGGLDVPTSRRSPAATPSG